MESTSASFATVFQWLDNTDIEGLNQAIIRQMGDNYSLDFERFRIHYKTNIFMAQFKSYQWRI